MKNLSSVILIFLLWATFLGVVTNCQSQASLGPTLAVDVTAVPSPSIESLSPTPSPTPEHQVEISETNNLYHPFPYEKVGDFSKVKFDKLSGIVFYPQRKTLFAVNDNGRIIEIKTDGSVSQQKKIRTKADFEGITYSPVTEMLYIAIEGQEVILEVNPENLEVERDIPINRVFGGGVLLSPEGNGIEGITFVPPGDGTPGGTFYLVNQSNELEGTDPSIIFEVEVSNAANESQARIIRYFSVGVTDLSGIHYISSSHRLLVISDTNNLLLVVSLSGQVLETYSLPGKKQEGITLDEDGFLYVAQDAKQGFRKFRPTNVGDTN